VAASMSCARIRASPISTASIPASARRSSSERRLKPDSATTVAPSGSFGNSSKVRSGSTASEARSRLFIPISDAPAAVLALMEKRSLLDIAVSAPALPEIYKNDFVLLATESLIKALEARFDRTPQTVTAALEQGFVLTPFFFEQQLQSNRHRAILLDDIALRLAFLFPLCAAPWHAWLCRTIFFVTRETAGTERMMERHACKRPAKRRRRSVRPVQCHVMRQIA